MVWEKIYSEKGVVQTEIVPAVEKAVSLLQVNKKINVLDAGCGTGRHSFYVAEKLLKSKLYCFDTSSTALEHLKKINGADIKCIDMNLGLPYKDNFFDLVLSILVIEHGILKEIKFNIEELKRVTRNDGYIVVVLPSTKDFRYKTGDEIETNTFVNTPQSDGEIPHHFFTDSEIESFFADFEVVYKHLQTRPGVTAKGTAYHWEYIFRKN